MAEPRSQEIAVNARILYWGIPGAGISSNLEAIHGRLKASNRGDIRSVQTRIDPSIEYEVLPIELGTVNGKPTQLLVIGAPGGPEQAPTRMQLLDQIDGIVFVADGRPECLEANVECLRELIDFLGQYGPSPSDLPLVIQYNKCDLVDPFAIERLHREIQLPGAAVFEASTKDGTGILKTLTTISKQVIRHLGRRQERLDPQPIADSPAPQQQAPISCPEPEPRQNRPIPIEEPEPDEAVWPAMPGQAAAPSPEAVVPVEPETSQPPAALEATETLSLMESAILAEAVDDSEAGAAAETAFQAQVLPDQPWQAVSQEAKPNRGARIGADLRIVSVGNVERTGDRAIRIPLVLGNDSGESVTLALTLQLDPLLDDNT